MESELLRPLRYGTLDQVVAFVDGKPGCLRDKDAETGRVVLHDALTDYELKDLQIAQPVMSLEKIQLLVSRDPRSIYETDNEGSMPLHVAAASLTIATDVFGYLLKAGPLALEVKTSNGLCPLHLAVQAACFRKAAYLLERHEGRFNCVSNQSVPPLLHMAIGEGAREDFVQLVLRKIPDSIKISNTEGQLPLHLACRFSNNETYDKAAQMPDQKGKLPMHYAALNGVGTETMGLLYNAYPPALGSVDNGGSSPLHTACRCSNFVQSETTISWLIDKNRLAVQSIDKNGFLPLHWAADNHENCTVPVIKLLAEKFPRALQASEYRGNLPLHLALLNTNLSSLDTVKFLLEKCPGAVAVRNNNGELPIHLACSNNDLSVQMLDLLIKYNPGSLKVFDNDGWLPFHFCCAFAIDRTIFDHMVAGMKNSALPTTKRGKPALFVACENDAELDVVMSLIQHSLELFSGSQMVSFKSGMDSKVNE